MNSQSSFPDPEHLLSHAAFLKNIARSLVLDDGQADDVVQEAYLAALQKPPPTGPTGAWLGKVAKNLSLMLRRGEGRRGQRERAVARPEPVLDTPSEMAVRVEVQRKVAEAVEALAEPYRSAIMHHFFDGLSADEMARRDSVSIETVRTRLKRARQKLRGMLDEGYGGDRRAWSLALLPLLRSDKLAAVAAGATATTLTLAMILKSKLTLTAALLIACTALLFTLQSAGGNGPGDTVRRTDSTGDIAKGRDAATGLLGGTADGSQNTDAQDRSANRAAIETVSIRGVVRNDLDAPVEGAELVDATGKTVATSNAAGQFEVPVAQKGVTTMQARAAKHVPQDLRLLPLTEHEFEITLQRAGGLLLRVVDPRGAGVADVLIELVPMTWNMTQEGREPILANADGNGVLERSDLAARNYRAVVNDPRFARAVIDIELERDKVFEREIKLTAGGVIRGRVLDADGAPVSGAKVRPMDDARRVGITDADGHYALNAMAAGEVFLMTDAGERGFAIFGNHTGWGRPVAVPVKEGETVVGIDMQLGGVTFVTGKALDDGGEPVPGMDVSVATGVTDLQHKVVTQADGSFRSGPHSFRDRREVVLRYRVRGTSFRSTIQLAKAPGAELDVGTLEIKRAGTVAGIVVHADGTPVRGGEVRVNQWGVTMVLVDGTFEVTGLEPGKEVHLVGHVDVNGQRRMTKKQSVQVTGGETTKGVRLVIADTFSVEGRVFGAQGEPRPGVWVGAVSPNAKPPFSLDKYPVAATDKEGRFRIDGLIPGQYRVGIADHGVGNFKLAGEPEARLVKAGAAGIEFEVPLAGAVLSGKVLSALDGKPLKSFQVWFYPGGSQNPREVSSGYKGAFRNEVEMAGKWVIEIRANGHANTRLPAVELKAGERLDLGVTTLPTQGSIEGTVLDATGAPVPFAQVHGLDMTMKSTPTSPFTGPDGTFTLPGASPGYNIVLVVSPKHPLGIFPGVIVPKSGAAKLEAKLQAAAVLELIVTDPQGQPIPRAKLVYTYPELIPLNSEMAEGYEPPSYGSNFADLAGVIRKPFLAVGKLMIHVKAKGFTGVRKTVALDSKQATRLEIRMQPAR
ncbi:MAG: sigma-70 family RNA polymerase sigma factor [Planctomycetota bacterium]